MSTTNDAVQNALNVAQPALTQALANLINSSVEAAQKGGEFLAAQLPDVIRQLLLYKAASSGILCLFGFVLIIAGLVNMYCIRKLFLEGSYKERYGDLSSWGYFRAFLTVFALVFGIVVFFTSWDWLEILLAPKLYLLEYATDLIKAAAGHRH